MTFDAGASAAYEAAFDRVLGDDFGNFMEFKMVVEESAFTTFGTDADRAKWRVRLDEMETRHAAAKAAGEAARAAFLAAAATTCGRTTFGLPCSKASGHSGPCAPVDTRAGTNW